MKRLFSIRWFLIFCFFRSLNSQTQLSSLVSSCNNANAFFVRHRHPTTWIKKICKGKYDASTTPPLFIPNLNAAEGMHYFAGTECD